METIRIACTGAARLDIDVLKELQGELKSLSKEAYGMLKKEILTTGFAFPIFVWVNEGTHWIIGGHQRARTLKTMRNEGYVIPEIPVIFIEAKDEKEARRRVLQDAAQYGQIERQGLYEFVTEMGLSPGDLASSFKLPELDLPSFNAEFFFDNVGPCIDDTGEGTQLGEGSEPQKGDAKEYQPEDFSKFKHKCSRCGFEQD